MRYVQNAIHVFCDHGLYEHDMALGYCVEYSFVASKCFQLFAYIWVVPVARRDK